MDSRTFDRLIVATAHASRRGTLRLLAAGVLGGILAGHRIAAVAAQDDRPDNDGDGLYDDDETTIYGTDAGVFDTDGDGVGDGEEVYNGTDPLTPAGGAALVAPADAPAVQDTSVCAEFGQSCVTTNCCTGYCDGELCMCASDGRECRSNTECCNGVCSGDGFCGACGLLGAGCNTDGDCCQGDYAAFCCFDGVSTRCTDVTNIGFVCPGDPVSPPPPPNSANGDPVAIGDVNSGGNADGAIGVGDTWGATCRGIGVPCDYDAHCCNTGPVLCCFDGTYLRTQCTDVTAYGGVCL